MGVTDRYPKMAIPKMIGVSFAIDSQKGGFPLVPSWLNDLNMAQVNLIAEVLATLNSFRNRVCVCVKMVTCLVGV